VRVTDRISQIPSAFYPFESAINRVKAGLSLKNGESNNGKGVKFYD